MAGRVRQTARQLSDGASLSRGQHPCIGVPPNLKGSCADSRIVTAIGQLRLFATGWNRACRCSVIGSTAWRKASAT